MENASQVLAVGCAESAIAIIEATAAPAWPAWIVVDTSSRERPACDVWTTLARVSVSSAGCFRVVLEQLGERIRWRVEGEPFSYSVRIYLAAEEEVRHELAVPSAVDVEVQLNPDP